MIPSRGLMSALRGVRFGDAGQEGRKVGMAGVTLAGRSNRKESFGAGVVEILIKEEHGEVERGICA